MCSIVINLCGILSKFLKYSHFGFWEYSRIEAWRAQRKKEQEEKQQEEKQQQEMTSKDQQKKKKAWSLEDDDDDDEEEEEEEEEAGEGIKEEMQVSSINNN